MINDNNQTFRQYYINRGNWGMVITATEELVAEFNNYAESINNHRPDASFRYSMLVSKANLIINMVTIQSMGIKKDDFQRAGEYLDIANFVAKGFDSVINAFGDSSLKEPFVQDRKAMMDVARPIILYIIDQAIYFQESMPNLFNMGIEITANINNFPDEYKNSTELINTLKGIRDYWSE